MHGLFAAKLWRRRRQGMTLEVTAAELARWLAEGRALQILDIRDAAAFQAGHLPGARRLPLDRLAEESARLDQGQATVVY
jgi:rhodanese-related sulfurtransferase